MKIILSALKSTSSLFIIFLIFTHNRIFSSIMLPFPFSLLLRCFTPLILKSICFSYFVHIFKLFGHCFNSLMNSFFLLSSVINSWYGFDAYRKLGGWVVVREVYVVVIVICCLNLDEAEVWRDYSFGSNFVEEFSDLIV